MEELAEAAEAAEVAEAAKVGVVAEAVAVAEVVAVAVGVLSLGPPKVHLRTLSCGKLSPKPISP